MQPLKRKILLAYRQLYILSELKVPRLLLKERFRKEWRHYFKTAKSIRLEADIHHLLETADLVIERLKTGVYPPFPVRYLYENTNYSYKVKLGYRKYIWNIWHNDIILEPGQDPPREPFHEPRQFATMLLDEKTYFREVNEGKVFPEEAAFFENYNGESSSKHT